MTHLNLSQPQSSCIGRRVITGALLFSAPALFACAARSGPSPILAGVAEVEAGWHHTCAITTTKGVKCWGNNHDGQLGDGTEVDRKTPQDVVGLSQVTAVTAGERHTCALTTAGGVKFWENNHDSQLVGDGTAVDRVTPVDVARVTNGIKVVSAGERHTCALTTAGAVKCWGNNHDGQLGDGTKVDKATPVDVMGLANGVSAIVAGWRHTCALTTAGGLKC